MSADPYRIDSHKLLFHPRRVADWLEGRPTAPIYMEISPSGSCNHRCAFCGLDFMGYKKRLLPTELLLKRQGEMAALGLRSVMYAGEGEPFLHPDMPAIARSARKDGLDVAFTTNASRFTRTILEDTLPACTWVKASVNAGTRETYARVHGVKPAEFTKVLENLRMAADIKRQRNLGVTLGLQTILLPENAAEMESLALFSREAGLDYFVVKPYSQHPQGLSKSYEAVRYEELEAMAGKLEALATPEFSVIFRRESMTRWNNADKSYPRCLATPFWSYLDSGGGVWGCSVHLGDERFLHGNILSETMEEIWFGERRASSLNFVSRQLDATGCRTNCRMEMVNRYLHELSHPGGHVNFI